MNRKCASNATKTALRGKKHCSADLRTGTGIFSVLETFVCCSTDAEMCPELEASAEAVLGLLIKIRHPKRRVVVLDCRTFVWFCVFFNLKQTDYV